MIKDEIPAVISMCIIPYSILAYQCCDSHSVNQIIKKSVKKENG